MPSASAKFSRPRNLLLICLALGWLFDFLFWAKPWGISFPFFIFALVAAGLWLARAQKMVPSRRALWLLAPVAFFALVSAFRTEPFTLFFSRAFTALTLCILAVTLVGGRWVEYGFSDFVTKLGIFIPQGLVLLANAPPAESGKTKQSAFRRMFPVLRGLLLALPLLWSLSVLLSSADPIFEKSLQGLFGFLNFDKAAEYAFRVFYVLVLAIVFAAVYFFALFKSRKEELIGKDKPVVKPFLGFTEAVTVLTSVNVLFATFVIVQFQYFFGGAANIVDLPFGFTYADYARRGFGELVFVAVTSLLLFIALSSVSNRKVSQQKWFSGLGIALFVSVTVILGSAFRRLLLYEDAYGFTRIRAVVHVFMIWLGLLLLAVVILELLHRRRAFAVATLLSAFGFFASLALLNVDGFIVHANLNRTRIGYELDIPYLASLSDDSVPALAAEFRLARTAGNLTLAEQIGAAIACQEYLWGSYFSDDAWQSWTWSRATASQTLRRLKQDMEFPSYRIVEDIGWSAVLGQQSWACGSGYLD